MADKKRSVYLTCTDATSNKFWQCDIINNTAEYQYGGIGKKVTKLSKTFDSHEKAVIELEKKIKSKTSGGYKIINMN